DLVVPDSKEVRPIEDTAEASARLSVTGAKARALLDGPLAPKGKAGTGRGGNEGDGGGKGKGDGVGQGIGKLSQREKRQQRWLMLFNTRSGSDYADQLMGLHAILAVETNNGEYMI